MVVEIAATMGRVTRHSIQGSLKHRKEWRIFPTSSQKRHSTLSNAKCSPASRRCPIWQGEAFPTFQGLRLQVSGLGTTLNYPKATGSMKPVELMRELTRRYTPLGGLVMDICMNTGVFGAAALMEGRRFICMELRAKQYEDASCGSRGYTQRAENLPCMVPSSTSGTS